MSLPTDRVDQADRQETDRILEALREEMDRIREAIERLSRWSDKMRLARQWAIVRKRMRDAIDARQLLN
jgi:hypothetical protein